MKLGGTVRPEGFHVMMGQDLAIVQNYEKGENLNTGEGPQIVSIRATNLFRKEAGAWKMVGHHTDLLPYMETRG
jgi:ketosteroid isomerase-like protein